MYNTAELLQLNFYAALVDPESERNTIIGTGAAHATREHAHVLPPALVRPMNWVEFAGKVVPSLRLSQQC